MEIHSTMTGWHELFSPYKSLQLLVAIASIITFEIYISKLAGYLILIHTGMPTGTPSSRVRIVVA